MDETKGAVPAGTSAMPAKPDAWVAEARPEFEDCLRQLVEIPTVSSDPLRKPEMRRGAEFAADLLRHFGAEARVVNTEGHPAVVGEFRAEGALRTITVYNHLDVQPATPSEWTHPPFTYYAEDGRYFARGATDDKGPALVALFAARRVRSCGAPLNIRFLWEMEEEIGSPNFEPLVRHHKDELHTDSVLVSDTVWAAKGRPCVDYGLRGLLGFVLRLKTGTKDIHSGLAGGGARNPFAELVDLINRMYDPRTGKVRIPGFYDGVQKPTKAEMESFLASGFAVSKFKAAHGLKSLRSNDPATLMKNLWTQPTFEVHGFAGGYSGPAIKTIIPPMAEVKLSMRLVPNQDPKRILTLLRKFVHEVAPEVEVEPHGFLEPYLGPSTGPFAEAATEAIKYGFGRKPAFIREGGSIGAVVSMARVLKAPVLLMGLSLPEHSYHGPDEHFDWGQASGGMKAFGRYFERVAEI
jgi:acetylornithine deacetylase/succinyl-diaminopimelate desuccinylase-like protein